MAQYGKPEYWEDRYQKYAYSANISKYNVFSCRDKEPFDWY